MVSLSECAERLFAAQLLTDKEFDRIKSDLDKVLQLYSWVCLELSFGLCTSAFCSLCVHSDAAKNQMIDHPEQEIYYGS